MTCFKSLSITVFLLVLVASLLVVGNEFQEVIAEASFADGPSEFSLPIAVRSNAADSDLKREKRSRSDFIADRGHCNMFHCRYRCSNRGCLSFYCTGPSGSSDNHCVCRGYSCSG